VIEHPQPNINSIAVIENSIAIQLKTLKAILNTQLTA
jgi:hypothetical protein